MICMSESMILKPFFIIIFLASFAARLFKHSMASFEPCTLSKYQPYFELQLLQRRCQWLNKITDKEFKYVDN